MIIPLNKVVQNKKKPLKGIKKDDKEKRVNGPEIEPVMSESFEFGDLSKPSSPTVLVESPEIAENIVNLPESELNPKTAVSEALVNATEAVVIASEALIIANEDPIIATEAPIIATEAPIIATEAPIIATEAPIIATEAPAIYQDIKEKHLPNQEENNIQELPVIELRAGRRNTKARLSIVNQLPDVLDNREVVRIIEQSERKLSQSEQEDLIVRTRRPSAQVIVSYPKQPTEEDKGDEFEHSNVDNILMAKKVNPVSGTYK